MPELPEVETVRRGLEPFLAGARIEAVSLYRENLRFPFPQGFAAALENRRIETLTRRAKYLLFTLSDGAVWMTHLGMTGAYIIKDHPLDEPSRRNAGDTSGRHVHFSASLSHPLHGALTLSYADPRRFGFMGLYPPGTANPFLDPLGPEPLGNALNPAMLASAFKNRKGPVKTLLLDQTLVAGLGNIYVCEALHRAGILPARSGASLVDPDGAPRPELLALVPAIRNVLEEALAAGGSTLRDFRNSDGTPGYFQHSFAVYGREGSPCPKPGCGGTVVRLAQAGRSSFYCTSCQH
ncbi:bifunctional DNA-formamidopyrimidine glycosylase/DNA-(apurinic or apyrimidinic site) lyase [Pelagibacterium limicola]|uniref:bifunctional DNA-formamidopyrimidine glycosylase/DNA-(apurinic or apyrimidinic site) lyase n=1 Tax=Pelagibacterium limicola TaxID=2791022 RepID=UPI0018AFA0DD|nr:bifunctional DNA-formamidopyrimidine glycosylase/DNA-(apurinic or apyrimidinic site) lyase [Pelagibacterium limicola]